MIASADRTPHAQCLRGRVVLPGRVVEDGLVVVEGDRISWVGPAEQAPAGVAVPERAEGVTLLPGLVDIHCHGGGGASFPDATDVATARQAAHEHLRHGTTSLVASLVTADAETLLARTAILADLADAGDLVGIHLEGPFLSRARCGAQDPGLMIAGDAALVRDVARVARGHLATMTVAPEAPGMLGSDGALVALAESGAIPSVGHTDATAELTEEALRLARQALARPGARSPRPTATHLFNGMRPLHHREPGPVAACLAAAARGEAVVELVADGVHLAPATVRSVFDLVGADSIALVTDAMAAAGMPDGRYQLGPVEVRVADGVARLADGDAIAGGTAHLLDVVRATVAAGVPLEAAVRAASSTPAAVLGRDDIGALTVGLRADVVEVDADLRPLRVMRGGSWIDAA
jgi:N-acetylglucosamine-6-phosphate deacetylase